MNPRGALVAAVAVLGSIGGLLAWQGPRSPRSPTHAPARATERAAAEQPLPAPTIRVDPRVGELLAQGADLTTRVQRLELAAAPEQDQDIEGEAEAKARALDGYRAILAAHESAAVDLAWAGEARTTLRADLAELTAELTEVTIVDVDCRSSSCIAQLELGSFVQAQAEIGRLVTHLYGMNCATRVQLDDDVDPDAPYLLDLVLHDCVDPDA